MMGRTVEEVREEGRGCGHGDSHPAQREMPTERWTSGQMSHVLTRGGET